MRVLLDTNIIIHRETSKIINKDIGSLFKWLDKAKCEKCVHPLSIDEISKHKNSEIVKTFKIKIESYNVLKTIAPLDKIIQEMSSKFDENENDLNDTKLLNEVICERVDLLITEDNKIHDKANYLNIAEKVFRIDSFLEKIVSEHPELANYKVLSVRQKLFGEIDVSDEFFDSFRDDYSAFNKWFNKKSDETAYVTYGANNQIHSFLFLKIEDKNENYSDIKPIFLPKKRLKIGTFKVISNGVRLGERFLKIIFDNAILNSVDEIYVTIFDKRIDQKRLINLLCEWGFVLHGRKGDELVYVRDFKPNFDVSNPKLTYPYISRNHDTFIVPIYPHYHTELLPDSILKTESADRFIDNAPHRNSISKVYISRSFERNIKRGDLVVFYRTAEPGKSGYYSSVISTIAIVEDKIDNIKSEEEFILKCRKRSIFTDDELKKHWDWSKTKPFLINFLSVYSFPLGKRLNRQKLLELGVLDGSKDELRGLKKISRAHLDSILKETETNESIIVN